MDFLDNVMKSSNALLKDRINNPFGSNKQSANKQCDVPQQQQQQTPNAQSSSQESNNNSYEQPESSSQNNNTSTSDQTPLTGGGGGGSGDDGKNSQFAAIAADAEAVTQKAVKGAKNIGTFLFSMANKAGQTVSQTAKQVKQAVENTSILTDFTKEQQEFIKEHGGSMQAASLPWEDIQDDAKVADIREQILSLSQDKRNFVRSPPNDSNFQFDPQTCYPVALSLLKEDPNLSKMRFELVPKLVSEDTFWCSYFYRVFLLKQMSDRGKDTEKQGWASSRSSSGEGPDEITAPDDANQHEEPASPGYSTKLSKQQQQQISISKEPSSTVDTANLESSESRKLVAEAEDLKSKLKELNIGSFEDSGAQDENDKWEEELQRDLQEFELVSGDVSALDEEALDKDIMELKKDIK